MPVNALKFTSKTMTSTTDIPNRVIQPFTSLVPVDSTPLHAMTTVGMVWCCCPISVEHSGCCFGVVRWYHHHLIYVFRTLYEVTILCTHSY